MDGTTGSVGGQGPSLDVALDLAARGYPVFPLRPGAKIPYRGSHGCLDATTDAATIMAWWKARPHANIGLATAGLLVVDIDPEGVEWLSEHEDQLPACPRARTPRGGTHLVMRQPEGRAWTIGSNQIAPAVDHRGDRGYIVVAPSTVDGRAYLWVTPLPMRERLPVVPDWLAVILDQIHGAPDSAPVLDLIDETTGDPAPHVERPAAEPVKSGRIPKDYRHRALVKMAGHARHVGHTEAEILALIQQVNRDRCDPPKSAYELAKLARSVCKYAPDQIAQMRVECVYEEAFGHPDPFTRPTRTGPRSVGEPPPELLPRHLLDVPGLIGSFMRWCLATAHRPQPDFALAAGICLQAAIAGRKVADTRGNRTNFYIVGTGGSGVGKDHPLKCLRRALTEAGAIDHLGPGEIASDAGLSRMVIQKPACVIAIDEFGRILKVISDERAGHLYGISTALLKLYSCANEVYQGKVYADPSQNVEIPYPCVSLLGMTVPGHLYKALTPDSLSDGLIARLLIVEADPDVQRQTGTSSSEVPADICEAVRWWCDLKTGGNISDGREPLVVPMTDEAEGILDDLGERVDKLAKSGQDGAGPIWNRAEEKALRLALIYACSACRESPVVTADAMSWACSLVEHRSHRMLSLARDWIAASDFDRLQKRVLRCIAKHDGRASRTDIGHALNDVPKRLREEVLVNMLDTGAIDIDHSSGIHYVAIG